MANERSPIIDVAQLAESDLQDYETLIHARVEQIDKAGLAYTNAEAHDTTTVPLGRILRTASFIPAPTDRVVVGRNGKHPQYVVVCRVGDNKLAASRANLISAINTYAKAGVKPAVTPHVLVGFGGETVQLVDLDHQAVFLQGTYSPPKPLTFKDLESQLIDSIIAFTIQFEAGSAGYAAINQNDGGHGVSFGFIQFNQRKGGLARLLKEMHRLNPDRFNDVFAGEFPGTGEPLAQKLLQPDWVKSYSTNLAPYATLFVKSAQYPEFQQAQRNIARSDYWGPAKVLAKKYGIESQRGYAILFDTCVQKGSGFVDDLAAQIRAQPTERAKLAIIARAADAKDGGKSWERREKLFVHTALSDAPISQTAAPAAAKEPVSDETAIVVMLEGRTGDPVSLEQRNAVAQALRVINASYGIPLTSARIVGLDLLYGATKSSNPGAEFNILDLIGAAQTLPTGAATSWFREPAPVLAEEITAAAATLRTRLATTRTARNLTRFALLQAYGQVKDLQRGMSLASYGRDQFAAAAALESNTAKGVTSTQAATTAEMNSNSEKPPKMNEGVTRGLLYDFDTGVWSDGKWLGKIES